MRVTIMSTFIFPSFPPLFLQLLTPSLFSTTDIYKYKICTKNILLFSVFPTRLLGLVLNAFLSRPPPLDNATKYYLQNKPELITRLICI